MKVVHDIIDISHTNQPIVLAMGCFDGVHIGHQKVISTAVEHAKKLNGEAWVYTFDPHPAKLLRPDKAPPLISAETCRIRQIEALGVQGIIETPFTQEFAKLTPDLFLTDLCAKAPTLAGITCGKDWSFGYRASGNFQTLKTFGDLHGFTAIAVEPIMDGEYKVSSTTIRQAILDGNIPLAEKLLGRPFSLFGTVVPGKKIGRELGYPTANIDPENELLPSPGIYTALTLLGNQPIDSAVFIGSRQTFACDQHVVESHLINYSGDLYGQALEVILIEKIRDAAPFPSREALIEQIRIDIEVIQERLNAFRKK